MYETILAILTSDLLPRSHCKRTAPGLEKKWSLDLLFKLSSVVWFHIRVRLLCSRISKRTEPNRKRLLVSHRSRCKGTLNIFLYRKHIWESPPPQFTLHKDKIAPSQSTATLHKGLILRNVRISMSESLYAFLFLFFIFIFLRVSAFLTMKIPPNRAAMSLLSRAAHRLATWTKGPWERQTGGKEMSLIAYRTRLQITFYRRSQVLFNKNLQRVNPAWIQTNLCASWMGKLKN